MKLNKWKPCDGEKYWIVNIDTIYLISRWDNTSFDEKNYKDGNCFKTKEEAQIVLNQIKKILKNTHGKKTISN